MSTANRISWPRWAAGLALAASLTACGGGGDNSTTHTLMGPDARSQILAAAPKAADTPYCYASAPVLSAIQFGAAQDARVIVGSSVSAVVLLSNDGTDVHSAQWSWGDGSSSPGTVGAVAPQGQASGDHVYSQPGTYTVAATLGDSCSSATVTGTVVVVASGG